MVEIRQTCYDLTREGLQKYHYVHTKANLKKTKFGSKWEQKGTLFFIFSTIITENLALLVKEAWLLSWEKPGWFEPAAQPLSQIQFSHDSILCLGGWNAMFRNTCHLWSSHGTYQGLFLGGDVAKCLNDTGYVWVKRLLSLVLQMESPQQKIQCAHTSTTA